MTVMDMRAVIKDLILNMLPRLVGRVEFNFCPEKGAEQWQADNVIEEKNGLSEKNELSEKNGLSEKNCDIQSFLYLFTGSQNLDSLMNIIGIWKPTRRPKK
jgi:hypothetical protein